MGPGRFQGLFHIDTIAHWPEFIAAISIGLKGMRLSRRLLLLRMRLAFDYIGRTLRHSAQGGGHLFPRLRSLFGGLDLDKNALAIFQEECPRRQEDRESEDGVHGQSNKHGGDE